MRATDVLSHIDEGELIALTRDLVRIPSVIRPGQPGATEAGVAAHVAQWMRKERFDVEVHEVAPGRPNVLGILGERESGGLTLLLEGHTDVVTEGDAGLWTRAPFGGDLVEGRIYGRGSADMKSGLAAAMVAAAAIKRSGVDLGGRLVVGALVEAVAARHHLAIPDRGALRTVHADVGRRLRHHAHEEVDTVHLDGNVRHGPVMIPRKIWGLPSPPDPHLTLPAVSPATR